MPIRVGILGFTGKIGALCVGLCDGKDLVFAGGVMRPGSAKSLPPGATIHADVASLAKASDVVVDFTHGSQVEAHAKALASGPAAWVVGTSGVSEEGRAAIKAASQKIPVVFAANFSLGMNVMLALAERLGSALPAESYDAEIIDIFHRLKVDAPSGTAEEIARAVMRGRGETAEWEIGRSGHSPRKPGAIGFSSLRGGAVAGENTLMMTSRAEQTVLTHKVGNPRVYAKGAMQAVRWVQGRKPGLYSMKNVVAGDAQ